MSEQQAKGFGHIVIEPDDDEFVIAAGIGSAETEGAPGVADASAAADAAPASRQMDVADVAPAPRQADAADGAVPREAADGYHPTTLADLERTPMPRMQLGVLIAVAAVIVGFVIYLLVG